jgi:hypothetical protein
MRYGERDEVRAGLARASDIAKRQREMAFLNSVALHRPNRQNGPSFACASVQTLEDAYGAIDCCEERCARNRFGRGFGSRM